MCMSFLLIKNLLPVLAVVLTLFLGGVFAVLLSGLGGYGDRLSVLTIGGGFIAAIVTSWLGAALLERRWVAAILFSLPLAVALTITAGAQQWWRCVTVLGCMAVSFAVVRQFQFDRRRS